MLVMNPPVSFRPDALGAELVRLRTDAHLSQRALARLADVSNTTISGLEQGDAPPPHPSILAKLAHGLATSGTGRIDEEKAEETYLRLVRAAGYVPSDPPPDDDALLRKLIEKRLGNRQNSELVQSVLDAARDRPPADQHTILSVVETLLRSMHPRPEP